MLGRVTQRSTAMNATINLQNAQNRSGKLLEQLTSRTSLAKGSDDSVRAAAALQLNDQMAATGEHSRNVDDAEGWMTTQENALTGVVTALQRVRDLTVQAGNTGAVDTKGRAALAAEINELKTTIMGSANTQLQGRAVFAGTSDATAAYDAGYATTDDGGAVTRTVSAGVDMTVNINATSVFGAGATSLFAELDTLAAKITAGDTAGIGTGLAGIDNRINLTTTAIAKIGARTNQLDRATDINAARTQQLTTQLDDVQGVDLAKTLTEFKLQDTAYQAALMATAKVIQPTLMDFLR